MDIEVRHARVVVTLFEEGSITKAAAKLDLPQPSVSAQLRRIEKVLGGELFVRSSAGVLPTPLGERLIPMLVDLASQAEAVVAEASSLSASVVRIGIAEWSHVSLTKAIQAAVGHLKIQTVTMDPAAGLEAVSTGALAAALVPSVEMFDPALQPEPGLEAEVIVREPIYLALPNDHSYAGHDGLSLAQLAGLTWVRHVPGHRFHPVEERLFSIVDSDSLDIVHEVSGQAEALSWVRDGGVAALTTPTGPIGGVSLLAVRETPHSKVDLLWRKGVMDPDTVEQLLEAIRSHFRQLSRRVPSYRAWLVDNVELYPELENLLS
jgi:DNA-binding transcriptional LysR family regulator